MAFARLLGEAKAEVAPPSPIKLREKRDTLRRFASRLRLNEIMLTELLAEDVRMTTARGEAIVGKSAVARALFCSQRRLPRWDAENDWAVDDRRWTRTGRGSENEGLAQTFLLSDDGAAIVEILERHR